MTEIHSLIDQIRGQEKHLSDIASKQAKASAEAERASRAVTECQDNIERLTLTEKSLGEAGSRYSAQAGKAIRRGLLVHELDQALQPLCNKAMIQAATAMTIEAKDSAGKTLLQLQRIASENEQVLKQVEEDFIQAEDQLETLRDTLRVMQQSQPV